MPKDVIAHVAYNGPGVAEGSMDVRELAPALLALGDLLQESNRKLNGDRTALLVHVQSDFKSGSFDIGLGLIVVAAAQQVLVNLGAEPIKTAKQIAEYIGLLTGTKPSLIHFLKWLRGRAATTEPVGNDNIIVKVDGDNNHIVIAKEVYELSGDMSIRKAVADVMRPLENPAIDTFQVRDGDRVIETVEKDDLPAITAGLGSAFDTETDKPNIREQLVRVVKVSFDPNRRWAFDDGRGGRFGAMMKDATFLSRVKSRERTFGDGDIFRVAVKTTQHIGPEGLSTEYEIVKVIHEFDAPRQMGGLLPEPESGDDI